MTHQNRTEKSNFDLQRRRLLTCGVMALVHWGLPIAPLAAAIRTDSPETISALENFLNRKPLSEPMLVLRDFSADSDNEIKTAIMRDLSNRRELLARTREKLQSGQRLTLSIDDIKIRLLYVPELDENFRRAYGAYCHQAIAFLLAKMGQTSFYRSITWPRTPNPVIPSGEDVTAFIVHRLSKQYIAECTFGASNGQKVRYRLKGAILSDHLGAVDLEIESPQTGQFLLRRKNYSIWQNHTKNLYTLLEIPLEETLHYIIGRHTDLIIQTELTSQEYRRVFEVQNLADHWLAVEEALVGGLVRQVLKEYAKRNLLKLNSVDMEQSLEAKKNLPQYRFREAGIGLVERMGYFESIELYRRDPKAFQRHLESV
jgi:hypothetical protein